jgi:hypothetical protein
MQVELMAAKNQNSSSKCIETDSHWQQTEAQRLEQDAPSALRVILGVVDSHQENLNVRPLNGLVCPCARQQAYPRPTIVENEGERRVAGVDADAAAGTAATRTRSTQP